MSKVYIVGQDRFNPVASYKRGRIVTLAVGMQSVVGLEDVIRNTASEQEVAKSYGHSEQGFIYGMEDSDASTLANVLQGLYFLSAKREDRARVIDLNQRHFISLLEGSPLAQQVWDSLPGTGLEVSAYGLRELIENSRDGRDGEIVAMSLAYNPVFNDENAWIKLYESFGLKIVALLEDSGVSVDLSQFPSFLQTPSSPSSTDFVRQVYGWRFGFVHQNAQWVADQGLEHDLDVFLFLDSSSAPRLGKMFGRSYKGAEVLPKSF